MICTHSTLYWHPNGEAFMGFCVDCDVMVDVVVVAPERPLTAAPRMISGPAPMPALRVVS